MTGKRYIICDAYIEQKFEGLSQKVHLALSYQGERPPITGEFEVCAPEGALVEAEARALIAIQDLESIEKESMTVRAANAVSLALLTLKKEIPLRS